MNTTKEKTLEQVTEEFIHDFFARSKNPEKQDVIADANSSHLKHLKEIGIPEKGRLPEEVVTEMAEQVYAYGYRSEHPRFLGFVPSTASKLSWLGDIMTSAFNRHAGSMANFPAGCTIENELLAWLCQKAGFSSQAGGLFVSGGSMANLTALTIARDKILGENRWHLGTAYVSEQTHSSVAKGLHIIGIPDSHIRKIAVDEEFRMDVRHLEQAIQEDLENGLLPFAVIASAGTTNTGSVDPFVEISAICKKHHIWMHVDGAFGASVLLCRQYRHLLKGIELADSLSWDAHKWLFQTYGCGMVLVNDKSNMVKTFHSHPEYLKDLDTEEEYLNPWNLGVELTRPARGLKLWLTLQVMGSSAVSDAIAHGFHLAECAQQELVKNRDVEIVSPARLATLNFRYAPAGLSEKQKDELNLRISREIIASGFAGIFTTELNGKKVLRICAIRPDTTQADIRQIIRRLNDYYYEQRSKIQPSAMDQFAS